MALVSDRPPHIVLFPFLCEGHLAPFLSLAAALRCRHPAAAITFVSTPRNIVALRSSLPPSLSSLRLHPLHFAADDHGLPAGVESLTALPSSLFDAFYIATESLQPGFDDLVSTLCGHGEARGHVCIIADMFLGWTVEVARKHSAFHAIFLPSGCYGTAIYVSLSSHFPLKGAAGDESFSPPEYPEVVIHRSQLPSYFLTSDGTDDWSVFLRRQLSSLHKTGALLVNSVEEFEAKGLGMFRRTLKVPVCPVGPLLRVLDSSSCSESADSDAITEWLGSHPPASVLYVSFGSQNAIRVEQMAELAASLEASRCRFVWAVRPPAGLDPRTEFRAEWLPYGFEERMRRDGRGLLLHAWAPQTRILAHGSVGAFLSHCGWNSVLESLRHGVPIIGWPLSAEQFFNAKMLAEEWEVCVEVARGNTACSRVDRATIEGAVAMMVMGETEKGKEMRRRAAEIREIMAAAWSRGGGGSSVKGLDEFLRVSGLALKKW